MSLKKRQPETARHFRARRVAWLSLRKSGSASHSYTRLSFPRLCKRPRKNRPFPPCDNYQWLQVFIVLSVREPAVMWSYVMQCFITCLPIAHDSHLCKKCRSKYLLTLCYGRNRVHTLRLLFVQFATIPKDTIHCYTCYIWSLERKHDWYWRINKIDRNRRV